MFFIKLCDFVSYIDKSVDLTHKLGVFVGDLFFAAESNYLNDVKDPTKPTRLANGTDHINVDIIKKFPLNDNVEEVTNKLLEYIPPSAFKKVAWRFKIKCEKENIKTLCYALAKTFFAIIKSSEVEPSESDINKWYDDCIKQPLIYKNNFDGEFKDSLIQDSGRTCPITGKTLKDSNTRIIQIYQKDISKEAKEELRLKGIEEPENENSIDNCLAVHSDFANEYDYFGKYIVEDIENVYKAKQRIINDKYMISSVEMLDLSKNIKCLIDKISKCELSECKDNSIDLNYNPIVISNKISDDKFLENEVISSCDLYYKKIKSWFLNAEDFYGKSFATDVSKCIKNAYSKEAKICTDKRLIIKALSKWIIDKCGLTTYYANYERAAVILVYFFIQNCEVFKDEVTE